MTRWLSLSLLVGLSLTSLGCPSDAARSSTAPPARAGSDAALARPAAGALTSKAPKAKPTPRASVLAGVGAVTTADDYRAVALDALPLLAAGSERTGQLARADDRDHFRVDAAAGETIAITAYCCGDVRLRLRTPQGLVVAEALRAIDHVADAGPYVLEVEAAAGQGLFYALDRK